jgi:arylsulfatase A-like enzyme
MSPNTYLKLKSVIYKAIDSLILFYFLLLWLFYYTGGFVYEFFGITVQLTQIKKPLIIITVLWLIKRLLLFNSLKLVAHFVRNIFLFVIFLLSVHVLNYVIYNYYLHTRLAKFDSHKELPYIRSDLRVPPKDWNVILISIDTLRADHLGCYGYKRATSPHIDKLATEGILFSNHIAAAPATLISHASMFTSLNPSVHKAEMLTRTALDSRFTTLAEFLKKEKFATAAFTEGGQLNKVFRLDQGFDRYDDTVEEGRVFDVLDRALAWLNAHEQDRFFLFLHTYQTHTPYQPPPPYHELFHPKYDGILGDAITAAELVQINNKSLEIGPDDYRYIIAQYDGEIAFMDEQLGHFFGKLKRSGLWEKTLIVLTSDHGEEFDEHGYMGWHSHTLFDEILKVPLIVKFPDSSFQGIIIRQQSRGIDIFPTIVDILGFQKPESIQGVSLFPLIKDPHLNTSLPAFSEKEEHELKSLRFDGYKLLVVSRKKELTDFEKFWADMFFYKAAHYYSKFDGRAFYNIETDPGETHNVYSSQKGLAKIFERKIQQLEEENTRLSGSFKPEKVKEDRELIRQLKGLGYLQ